MDGATRPDAAILAVRSDFKHRGGPRIPGGKRPANYRLLTRTFVILAIGDAEETLGSGIHNPCTFSVCEVGYE